MIKVFEATAKKFDTNGLKVIFPISCIEYKKESLNGWHIEAEISIKFKPYLIKDNIIVAKTKSKLRPQAFRIKKIEEHTSTIIVMAEHVIFDAENYFLEDVRPTDMTALNALNYVNERTDIKSPFTFFSDVTKISTQYVVDKNLLEAMALIEERWGGKFDADNYDISFKQNLGNNNGEIIRQKKNLISRVISEDWSNVVTKLYPKGPDDLKLPEKFLKSDIQYKIPYTKALTFDFEVEDDMTEKEKVKLLRDLAKKHLEENKYPQVCYELEANLQNVEIGDQVKVIDISLDIMTSILEYEYDLNTEKIRSIIFGNYTKNVREKFNNIKEAILETISSVSKQQAIINHQTELINSLNKNGIVKITDNEILILDKIPIESAKNVWRFGLGGLAFSSNGYEGPFETAITIDGQINAKFITSGKMSTQRIEGLDELFLTVNKISNERIFYDSASDYGKLIIEKAQNSLIQELHITGEMELLIPSDDLIPSDNLVPLDSLLVVEDSNGVKKKYRLPIGWLYTTTRAKEVDGEIITEVVSDEFVIERIYNEESKNYESKCKVIRRVGVNDDGTRFTLANEQIEDLGILEISLNKGTNKIYLESFESMNYKIKYAIINEVTEEFVTHLEMSTTINMTEEKIEQSAKLKVDNSVFEAYQTLTAKEFDVRVKAGEIIASINLSSEEATINASKINLKAADIINLLANNSINLTSNNITLNATNVSIDENGNLKASNVDLSGKINATSGTFGGWTINVNSITTNNAGYGITIGNGSNKNKDFLVIHDEGKDTYPFYVRATGYLHAENGDVGGISLASTGMYFNNGNSGFGIWGTTGNNGIIFHAGSTTSSIGNAPFKIYHSGKIEMTSNVGYFSFGGGSTNHPWMSAANVSGYNGINFYDGTSINSVGTQRGYISLQSDNDLEMIATTNDAIIGGYHVKLSAREGNVYVSRNGVGNKLVATEEGNLSSLSLKENLKQFDENEYKKAYELLKNINFYRFDYKYKISDYKNEYGFIIDYIEEIEEYDRFLFFKEQKAKVLKNKELDYLVRKEDKNILDFKKYDSENLTKFLMASLKSLQLEIEKIKEMKFS